MLGLPGPGSAFRQLGHESVRPCDRGGSPLSPFQLGAIPGRQRRAGGAARRGSCARLHRRRNASPLCTQHWGSAARGRPSRAPRQPGYQPTRRACRRGTKRPSSAATACWAPRSAPFSRGRRCSVVNRRWRPMRKGPARRGAAATMAGVLDDRVAGQQAGTTGQRGCRRRLALQPTGAVRLRRSSRSVARASAWPGPGGPRASTPPQAPPRRARSSAPGRGLRRSVLGSIAAQRILRAPNTRFSREGPPFTSASAPPSRQESMHQHQAPSSAATDCWVPARALRPVIPRCRCREAGRRRPAQRGHRRGRSGSCCRCRRQPAMWAPAQVAKERGCSAYRGQAQLSGTSATRASAPATAAAAHFRRSSLAWTRQSSSPATAFCLLELLPWVLRSAPSPAQRISTVHPTLGISCEGLDLHEGVPRSPADKRVCPSSKRPSSAATRLVGRPVSAQPLARSVPPVLSRPADGPIQPREAGDLARPSCHEGGQAVDSRACAGLALNENQRALPGWRRRHSCGCGLRSLHAHPPLVCGRGLEVRSRPKDVDRGRAPGRAVRRRRCDQS